MSTYRIASDTYSPTDDIVTIPEFEAMCVENDWDVPALRENSQGDLYDPDAFDREIILVSTHDCLSVTARRTINGVEHIATGFADENGQGADVSVRLSTDPENVIAQYGSDGESVTLPDLKYWASRVLLDMDARD